MNKNALIIFIKNPELGRVKTRIAASTSDDRALEIYEELLVNTREVVLSSEEHRILYYSTFIDEKDDWSFVDFEKKIQNGDGLGEKMYHALSSELVEHEHAVLVGSDIGALTSEIVDQAFSILLDVDIVIGPALDGGYYLIGMNKPINIFDDIEWSTINVLKETIAKIEDRGLSYYLLPILSDIDFIEDYNMWKKESKLS